MIINRLRRNKEAPAPEQADIGQPDSDMVYVIGDVHGCFDELCDLMTQIEADIYSNPGKSAKIVFLGDLIDRGPASYQVVQLLKDFRPHYAKFVFLKGNHEEVFLDVLKGDATKLQSWFEFGGRECARSYGVRNLGEVLINPKGLLKRIQDQVPKDHVEFLDTFKDYFIHGRFLCVHAGIRPGVKLEKQTRDDMLWIRKRFIESKKQYSHIVIHGHTIVDTIEIHPNRIAIDTGAYSGGALSAVKIENNTLENFTSKSKGVAYANH